MAIERIQLRRGTTEEWGDANPVLSFGEPGVEVKTDSTLSVKIGDGVNAWAALPYFGELEGNFVTDTDLSDALASYSTISQTNIAISTQVNNAISNLINSAPQDLDTLNELATALGDDPNFASTIITELGNKSDVGHSHIASDITDFSAAVAGEVSGIASDVSDLQTNKTDVGHTHTTSDITDIDVSTIADLTSVQVLSNKTINSGKFISPSETMQYNSGSPGLATEVLLENGSVFYFNGDMTKDVDFIPKWSSTADLRSQISNGESISFTIIVKNGSTPYKINGISIDNNMTGVTTIWQNADPFPDTTANAHAVYSFTFLRITSSSYRLFAGLSTFG